MVFYFTNYLEWILNNDMDRTYIIKEIKKMNNKNVSLLVDNDIYRIFLSIISKYENTLDWEVVSTNKGWKFSTDMIFDRLSQETRGYIITYLCSRKVKYYG